MVDQRKKKLVEKAIQIRSETGRSWTDIAENELEITRQTLYNWRTKYLNEIAEGGEKGVNDDRNIEKGLLETNLETVKQKAEDNNSKNVDKTGDDSGEMENQENSQKTSQSDPGKNKIFEKENLIIAGIFGVAGLAVFLYFKNQEGNKHDRRIESERRAEKSGSGSGSGSGTGKESGSGEFFKY